jgi:hypothetical protein
VSRLDRQLAARLREQPLPGEVGAGSRAWPVVAAALAERAPVRPRRRLAARWAPALTALVAGVVLALTPAGPAVGDWIEARFAAEPVPAVPAFAGLPEGGPTLALADSGAFAVHPDGSIQRLGAFSDAGWSPRGLHAVGVSGRRVVAVDPTGTPRWSVSRPRPLSHPAWSPGDGFFVAYLEAASLRVVGGNGVGDRLVRRGAAAAVAPAWRPGRGYALSYARAQGVETVDVLTGARLWLRPAAGIVELAWTRDGERLALLLPGELRVLDRGGRLVRRLELPAGGRATGLALHPSGTTAAVLIERPGGTRVVELGLGPVAGRHMLFSGLGEVAGLEWSPDGRHLLVAWRDADQWLLIGPGRRPRSLTHVSRELGAGSGFPRLAGWCCTSAR